MTVRFLLSFALAFLPLAGSLKKLEPSSETGMMMSVPVPVLVDSAKLRTSVSGVERVILYFPSLYANYRLHFYNAAPDEQLLSIFFSRDVHTQWQRWQI